MILAHLGGRTFTLDGSGPVPRHFPFPPGGPVDPNGYRATSVPTTLATLGVLHRQWGRLPWKTVVQPGVALARSGFPVTALQRTLQLREMAHFGSVASGSGSRYFLKGPGRPFEVGDPFRQPDLAALLDTVAVGGPEAFYLGPVAERIAEDMNRHGGFLGLEDLADIPWPAQREALESEYRGLRIVSAPPPMGGRLLLFILKVLDTLPTRTVSAGEWTTYRLMADLFRTALGHRHDLRIPPDRYDPTLDPLFTDPGLAGEVAEALTKSAGLSIHGLGELSGGDSRASEEGPSFSDPSPGHGETTHLSVMDAEGNAVGITQSVNMVYGSKAAAEGLGFLYNNYLLDTHPSDLSHPHFLKAGNRPWSSACPTLVFVEGEPWLMTGSPGSDRIITTVAQFLVHVIDGGLGLDAAVERPRIHCTAEGEVSLEADRFPPGTAEAFEDAGYSTVRREPYAFYHGAIHAVLKEARGPGFQGMAEVRRDGVARGP